MKKPFVLAAFVAATFGAIALGLTYLLAPREVSLPAEAKYTARYVYIDPTWGEFTVRVYVDPRPFVAVDTAYAALLTKEGFVQSHHERSPTGQRDSYYRGNYEAVFVESGSPDPRYRNGVAALPVVDRSRNTTTISFRYAPRRWQDYLP